MAVSNSVSRTLRYLLRVLDHVSRESLYCVMRALTPFASNPAGSRKHTVTDIYSRFDAPALFARDIRELETFVRAWCGPREHPQHQKVMCSLSTVCLCFV